MKFTISTNVWCFRAIDNEFGHIHFCDPDADLSMQFINAETADVWICNGKEVTNELMDRWLDRDSHIPKTMLVEDAGTIPRLEAHSNGRVGEIEAFPEQNDDTIPWAESILRAAEMLYARTRAKVETPPEKLVASQDHKASVLLVGAGIVNLMTAELLVTRGFQVRIVDASPDPRSCEDWTRLGVTSGGGNARMFTYMEADNYNEKGSEIYQNMRSIFRQTARKGGWSLKSSQVLNPAELAWVNAFERLPAWLARAFRENIYHVNREAGKLWKEYIETAPRLFEGVAFCKDILRMYVEPVALRAALELNSEHGTIMHASSAEEFLKAYPQFRSAAESDNLAGGFTVEGFTVNVHQFVAKLIDRIAALGGEFTWNCRVQRIQRNTQGEITMLESQKGRLEADHFVLSPGVTGNELLKGTASENLLQGVLGVWLQIPNLHPQMQHSIKIHRRGHLVEDINVTVAKDTDTGEDTLVLGGGYGYVGLDRPSPDCPELSSLFDELENVARIYFPQGYAVAKERGTLWPGGNRKFCVRPFTPTGLGLFETVPTANGGHLIITGGNNTGGFAQAPAVARAVWRALIGEHDPMHVLFHPDRGRPPKAVTYRSRSLLSSPLSNTAARPSLKLLLLCSDGPQHSYLRYRLDQAFPGYRCIVETSQGQSRHLFRKGRMFDACYMEYHSLRRSILGHKDQRKAYFDRLVPQDYNSPLPDLVVDNLNCRKVWEAVEEWQPELTIVSGTKYIGRKLNERAGLMINLHIGHLPEYKGNHCIFFALYDGAVDRVAATLHQLTPNLDGGDILATVVPPVLSSDNEETLYTRCLHMAIERSIEVADQFSSGQTLEFVPQKTAGRMFRHCDRTPAKELWLWWSLSVYGLLRGCAKEPNLSTGGVKQESA